MKTKVVRLTTAKTVGWTAVLCLIAAVLFAFPQAAANGARHGLGIASQVLIPHMLPFLVLSGWLARSGLCERIGKTVARPLAVLGLPPSAAAVCLIGLLGGYPSGAAAISALYRENRLSPAAARRLLAGCVSAGPGFCVATVGGALLGSVKAGLILWAANALSAVIVLLCYPAKREPMSAPSAPPLAMGSSLVAAVYEAARSLIGMTAFVTLAGIALSLISAACPFLPTAVVAPILEVTSGVLYTLSSPFWLGWTLGFGGLSVHGQIAALLPSGLIDGGFFLARLCHGMLGGLLTLWWLPSSELPTFATLSGFEAQPFASASALGGISLIVLSVTWLASMRKKVDF